MVFAEILLFFVVLAPNSDSHPNVPLLTALPTPSLPLFASFAPILGGVSVPFSVKIIRVAAGSIFFIPFGAAVGMGFGLLLTGLVAQIQTLKHEFFLI